ncbi:hypothetical protein LEP1GSC107_4294 [Leptospira interrogans serovar Grippotyphosa str. UI 12769]|nr:hypothetical protein LEP1GSC097_3880 [Leptospira interrogans serovar Grippotyphosa str. UI 08368]EMN86610.1 hypothetical protein LEP1GSC107_4294 [Leptospira interrogans serovar Grippotyphosa str. UI 12769]
MDLKFKEGFFGKDENKLRLLLPHSNLTEIYCFFFVILGRKYFPVPDYFLLCTIIVY